MYINGKNYLLLERRGCEYFKADEGRDNIGNYRVGSYDHSITGKDGRNYILEFSSRDAWTVRKTNKRTGQPLKHPVTETAMKNALGISTEYEEDKEGCGYKSAWRNAQLEKEFYTAAPVPYCIESILEFVNNISVDHYDAIKWVESFETTRPADKDWTPASLIMEWAKAHKLEVLQSKYFETFVKLYSGNYKFLRYQIEPGNKENAKITIFLERRETA